MKQYLYGDRRLEEVAILMLRQNFLIPLTCQTPVHLMKADAERRFADQADREFELVNQNTHPFQLALYEIANKYYYGLTT